MDGDYYNNLYLAADSNNLPSVDNIMLMKFATTANRAEIIELQKLLNAAQFSYGAIGYVKLKRIQNRCILLAKIVADINVRAQIPYFCLSVNIDEDDESICETSCDGCPNFDGACKHVLLLLSWLTNRKNTPYDNFWRKPVL